MLEGRGNEQAFPCSVLLPPQPLWEKPQLPPVPKPSPQPAAITSLGKVLWRRECPAEPVAKAGGLGHSEGPSQCVLCCLSPNQHSGAELKGAQLSPASVAEGVLLLSSYAWKVLRMETQPTVP